MAGAAVRWGEVPSWGRARGFGDVRASQMVNKWQRKRLLQSSVEESSDNGTVQSIEFNVIIA